MSGSMRAVVMRDKRLMVADVPTPEPGPGEVLVKTLACVIRQRKRVVCVPIQFVM